MGKVIQRKAASEQQKDLKKAEHDYIAGLEPSMRSAARTYGVPYGTLRGHPQGAKPRADAHSQEQILSVEEEKAIVRLCLTLDDRGHPLRGPVIKTFAISLLPPALLHASYYSTSSAYPVSCICGLELGAPRSSAVTRDKRVTAQGSTIYGGSLRVYPES